MLSEMVLKIKASKSTLLCLGILGLIGLEIAIRIAYSLECC